MEDLLTAINKVSSFYELKPFLENAQVKITFWGGKKITVEGYSRQVLKDDISEKIFDLLEDNPHFSEEERKIGQDCVPLVKNILEKLKTKPKKTNCLTKIFIKIRRWFLGMSQGNFYMRCAIHEAERNLSMYTKIQFEKTFGYTPKQERYSQKQWDPPVAT